MYSDFLRGVPLLVLIFFVYYGLPVFRINLSNFWAAVFALAAFKTAHVIEIVRGAVQSIPRGQTDAGRAIGLTFAQRLLCVIAPQALRRFLPPWINAVVDTVKGSALVSLVGIVDLMLAIQQVIGRTYVPLPMYVLGAAHLLRDQLQPVPDEPPARGALRLCPGIGADGPTGCPRPQALRSRRSEEGRSVSPQAEGRPPQAEGRPPRG